MSVNVRVCQLYLDSLQVHAGLKEKIAEFIQFKTTSPLEQYGGSDTHFTADGPIGRLGLKIKHAHITQDVSILYRLHGKPTNLDLYGVFSHKELGTGNSPNVKTQQKMSKRFKGQFD